MNIIVVFIVKLYKTTEHFTRCIIQPWGQWHQKQMHIWKRLLELCHIWYWKSYWYYRPTLIKKVNLSMGLHLCFGNGESMWLLINIIYFQFQFSLLLSFNGETIWMLSNKFTLHTFMAESALFRGTTFSLCPSSSLSDHISTIFNTIVPSSFVFLK